MEIPPIGKLPTLQFMNTLHKHKKLSGLYYVSNELYHSGPGVSSSFLKKFTNVPADALVEQKSTVALDYGNALHTYVLEPAKFNLEVAIQPEIDRRTKAGKLAYAEFIEKSTGKYVINQSQFEDIKKIAMNVEMHPRCQTFLNKESLKEVAAYHYDDKTGELLKAKCDILHFGKTIIFADLKTTANPEPYMFRSQVRKWKYHVSAAMYCDVFSKAIGEQINSFVWIFCGKTAPFQVETAMIGEKMLQTGHDIYRECLAEYAFCKAMGDFPSSTDLLHIIEE